MAEKTDVDLQALSDLCTPWCLHVTVTLRVAEHITAGSTQIDDLAKAAGADPDALARVLRHLIGKGVFVEPEPGRFALNPPAEMLREETVRLGLDLDGFGGRMARAWSSLLAAVRTGKPAYIEVFGRSYWEDLEAHPEIAADLDALMGPGHGTPDPEILPNRDWDAVRCVVDVGGGTGSLLAEVLRAHPDVRGILVDLPRTVARSAEVFAAAGVADRVTTVGQSFFDALPAGGDVYAIKNVLNDWPDTEAHLLLQRCADAARPNGRVAIVGGVSPNEDGSAAPPNLLMLVLVGGRDRTLTEFRTLAASAGLRVTAWGHQPSGRFVVECRSMDTA